MLKLTTPKLLIVLAVLVGVFFLVRYTGNKGKSKSLKTELVSIDISKVTQLEFVELGSSTKVFKEGETWYVETPVGPKKADESKVSSTVSTLNSIEPSRIASRSESTWQDFAVDSTGTRVKVYYGKELASDITLGRFGVEGQRSFYTYVRLTEDKDTYVANNFMKMSISTQPEDFRNGDILKLQRDSLNTITFNYPDSAIVLTRDNGVWYKGQVPADSANTASYIRGLNFVTSKKFVEAPSTQTPTLNVTFGFTNQPEIQVSAYEQGSDWVIQSSVNPEEYWIDPDQFNKVFSSTSIF